MDVLWCAVVGLAAGVVSAMFGVGGGVVVVPLLLWLDPFDRGFDIRLAVGTSLAMIVPTAIVGVWRKAPLAQVDFRVAAILAAGGVVGAWGGAWLANTVPADWLKKAFALLLVGIAARLFLEG
jgi:uncharacterized membrane protein YfcA